MNIFYVISFFVIVLLIFIGTGIEISNTIDDTVIYLLFWFLYGITYLTFVNICLSVYYYFSMKDKQGPPGPQGLQGDRGDSGNAGICSENCRDSICENTIEETVLEELRSKMVDSQTVKLNNTYLKNKIKQMCRSPQFKQLAPYNGPYNLINYLKEVWKKWVNILYDAGGMTYFETIGAEMEWEWVKDNPFSEIMKYDVFYWGMDKNYQPQVLNKCYLTNDGVTPVGESYSELLVCKTNIMSLITTDSGSGSTNDVMFYRPKQFTYNTLTYYPVGDIAIGPTRVKDTVNIARTVGAITMPLNSLGPNRESILVAGDVVGPLKYNLIWSNKGYKGSQFYVWRPIAPKNYMSLGDIITTDSNPPPTGVKAPIRCVRESSLIKIPGNGNVLYSSAGSDVPTNLNILGFVLNNGSYVTSSDTNAYNLFRGIAGFSVTVPDSDVNARFYKIDPTKYDPNNIPGRDSGTPSTLKDANRIGKGYLPIPQKDAKYSILAYLDLKNEGVIVHEKTNTRLESQIVANTTVNTSNSYFLKINDKCLNNVNGQIKLSDCDSRKLGQIFSIEFTGNKRGQCRLKEADGEKFIIFKDNAFSLVDKIDNKDTTSDLSLFIMN